MEQFRGLNGEIVSTEVSDLTRLRIDHVLQRYRDVWVPIETYPYLAINLARVDEYFARIDAFAVFSHGLMFQNLQPREAGERLISSLVGPGVNAGISPNGKFVVEGAANPSANFMVYFNNPFMVGMHPFAALGTKYIYIEGDRRYQREIAELVVVDKHSRPRSNNFGFDPLADMLRIYHRDYLDQPRDVPRDLARLATLLDDMFIENERILTSAENHHRSHASQERPFDYVAPTLTRYGRLTHDDAGQPRIEISFALVHYEKALREFNEVKLANQSGNTEAAFFHGVYCVVAVAACAEAIANKLVFQQTQAHPDYRDRRQALRKINDAGTALAQLAGGEFVPLASGQPVYDALDAVRELRNAFMHAKERGEEVDSMTLTSSAFTKVDEQHCRSYLQSLRLAVEHVYIQIPVLMPPIVTRQNVTWLGDVEVP